MLAQAADLGVLQLHLSGGEPTVRRDLEAIVAQAAKVGLYSNLITSAVTAHARAAGGAGGGRPRPRADLDPGRGRPPTPTASRATATATPRSSKRRAGCARSGLPLTINAPDASPEHRQPACRHRSGRRASARSGSRWRTCSTTAGRCSNRAGPDADARAGAAQRRAGRARARAAQGRPRHRFRGARLLRQAAEAVHGRLGARHHQHHAVGQGAALPRRRDHPGPRLRQRARTDACATSGSTPTPSRNSAARPGCASPAAPASCARSTGAAAAARPLPSPAMRPLTDPACAKSSLHQAFTDVAEREVGTPRARARLPEPARGRAIVTLARRIGLA